MALKKIILCGNITAQQKATVAHEAQLMARIQDKHFIKMFHSFWDTDKDQQEVFCILMEHAENGDLLQFYIKKCKE
jgi:serine/threonine protein kinase